jgi:hypothetical protein
MELISQFDGGTGDLLSRSKDSREGALENGLLEVGWFGHQQALVDQERSIRRCRNLRCEANHHPSILIAARMKKRWQERMEAL